MTQPWLSVLMPTYNGEAYLSSALDSILAQNDHNIECIVVDDGSTDATLSILETYKKKLPMIILQRERRGNWVANTNYALTLAKGDYVCFLHQDDLWYKNRLRIMKDVIKDYPKVDFFLHSSIFIDSNSKSLGLWKCPLPAFPETIKSSLMMEKLLIQNFISIPAPIFKRVTALKAGGLDETLWYTADWDLWLKICAGGNSLYYPEPLSGFRVHSNSQTIVRSSYLQDFRNQLESVVNRYLLIWDAPESKKKEVRKISFFSIKVNASLAGSVHKKNINLFGLFVAFFLLGPKGWHHYLNNSRIWERVFARAKTQIISTRKNNKND